MHELKAVNATACTTLPSTVVCLLLGEPESLWHLNLPITTAVCSCVCMALGVTHCLCFGLLCDPVNICDSCSLLCVCHLMQLVKVWKETAWIFLASSCSKQNSLCFIFYPLMCSSNYALLVLHPFDVSTAHSIAHFSTCCQQSIHFIIIHMLVLTYFVVPFVAF